MKTIKKEINVIACEICGKEISEAVMPYRIMEDKKEKQEEFVFHQECVDKLLIKEAKMIN